ncbi:peptide-methionine (R)-S-oxide reductase [Jannaschia sp. LMIT008]|uniref:peptide-methionine (R)-S-oxide reductase n=1 Tax=Jannaschia maritima TaxID=3032585 RepID=UPI0028110183|nr:peptide-methionine (R)-S-oxide reductase [Jannaschia sp. LMIT008]
MDERRTTAVSRRQLMAGSAALALAPAAAAAQERVTSATGKTFEQYVPATSDFPFEVTMSEEQWRADLGDDAYKIMREADTEWPKTTDLWREAVDGEYRCRGCDLPVYDGAWFVPLDKGWVFFEHSIPNAIMLGIDGPVRQYGQVRMADDRLALIEIHCRRCGCHLGHHLDVDGQNLHCINGTALEIGQRG